MTKTLEDIALKTGKTVLSLGATTLGIYLTYIGGELGRDAVLNAIEGGAIPDGASYVAMHLMPTIPGIAAAVAGVGGLLSTYESPSELERKNE